MQSNGNAIERIVLARRVVLPDLPTTFWPGPSLHQVICYM